MDIKIPQSTSKAATLDNSNSVQSNSLGETFYRERTKKNISLEDVAESTCIHIATLRAIEAGDRDKMPAEVFSRGFVKLYAEFLGLDTQDILDRYNNEIVALGGTGKDSEMLSRSSYGADNTFFTFPRILFLVVVLLLLALGYWLWSSSNSPFSRESREIYFQKYYVEHDSLYAAQNKSSKSETTRGIITSVH